MCGLWGQEWRWKRFNFSCRSIQGQHVTSTQANLKISNRMMLLPCLQSQSKLTLKHWSLCLNGHVFFCCFFYHLEQIGCICSVTYFIKTAQTGSLRTWKALSQAHCFRGKWQAGETHSQSLQTVIHKDSDCTWAPIQTACQEEIFTPQFRHYSHTTMPLVDKEHLWLK